MTVSNQNTLVEQAWINWVECLVGEDTNSIFRQISLMIWDTAIFRIILASRKNYVQKNPGAPAINGSLHSFIDRNYFDAQSAYIRRLTDRAYGITGDKGVYSLNAIVKDICRYRNELTRERYFTLRNLTYEFDWEEIEETHQIFDRLCGAKRSNRKPDDVIPEKVFVRLKEKLDTCKIITNYVDKYVAHSATPESRYLQNVKESEVTLTKLWDAQYIVYSVANFLVTFLYSEGHMALSFEPPYFQKFWDVPLYETEEINQVRTAFQEYWNETGSWNTSAIKEIWDWIET